MLLSISHKTQYTFENIANYGVQQLRLTPKIGPTQSIKSWDIDLVNGHVEAEYLDHNGNQTHLVQLDKDSPGVTITSHGFVEILRGDGIVGHDKKGMPLWYFKRQTRLTTPGSLVSKLAKSITRQEDNIIKSLHDLSDVIRDQVDYQTGTSDSTTTAEDALMQGAGVCQDHAQIFLSVARSHGYPARYVSGYIMLNETEHQEAMHAWAEVWVKDLGWVGFDISNGVSPDQKYVRVATGLDYRDAAPISGITYGVGQESINVDIQVQQ